MIEPADDLLHELTTGDRSWTETWWYPVYVPELRVSAYLYAVVRPTAQLVAGGVLVWDDRTNTSFDALFCDYRWADHFVPAGGNDLRFDSGLSIDIVEPLKQSRIRYANADSSAAVDVTFTATGAPHTPSNEAKGKGIKGHFDQPGTMRGTLVLDGREIAVDSHIVRDRSWGPRPDAGRRWWGDRIGYTTGAADGLAFLAVSHPGEMAAAEVFDGFVDADGVRAAILRGTRRLSYNSEGRIDAVQLDLVDVEGRAISVAGEVLNRCTFQSIPSMMTTVSMVAWTTDSGTHAVGEDQDVWWQHSWRKFARSRRLAS